MTTKSDIPEDRQAVYLNIPDLLVTWPWLRKHNPLQNIVAEQGNVWLRSLAPFNTKSQYAFDQCDFGLFAALSFPDATEDQLRTGLDLMYLSFVIDEYTDVEPAHVVQGMVDICKDALRDPLKSRPRDEVVLGEMTRQFWERALRTAGTPSEAAAQYFLTAFVDYLDSLVIEAEARDRGRILQLTEFLAIRIQCAGVRLFYAIRGLYLSIPKEAVETLEEMVYLGSELIAIDNDILSFNRERAAGLADFNIVTVVMHQFNLNLDGAIDWLTKRTEACQLKYMECMERVTSSSYGPDVDSQILALVNHMGNFRRACWSWSFECGRYFGDRGEEFAQKKKIPLLPNQTGRRDEHGDRVEVVLMTTEFAKFLDRQ